MAWHAAAAAASTDARAAHALGAVAEDSRARGAYSAAAAAYERAARLTPDSNERPIFFAQAADTAWLSGQTSKAVALVAEGLSESPAPRARAELLAHRGRFALYGEDQEVAFDTLLEAARLLEDADRSRAAELLADAVGAGLQVGGAFVGNAAERLAALETKGDPLRELLVAQALLAATSVAGDVGGHDRLERALGAAEAAGILDESPLHLFWAGRGRFMRGHNAEAAQLARRTIDAARRTGALALLPQALRLLARRTSIGANGGRRTRPQAKPSSSDVSLTKIPRSARAWAYLPTSTQRRGAPNRVRGTHPPRSRSRPSGDSGSTANELSARSDAWLLRPEERRTRSTTSRACTSG